ncbi:hypothetical protein BRYFOR_08285 [Marvinbryantia formatexigens DSM 14469]|uniref:Uncharacterized protein n=1 Tax=Marvinbryantia formatexigens DSM 14469 TaxID=478749 RepID=C6LI14_9FIRM|nr:hypothetical protein [Marvinbryantia formatexigens]EET59669.1 hypothetical protein BRYFOR_08285 [Marvinbryantia formatexigens DSM 14469]UWO26670.1 hypothetical protein NQ534_09515 [Marvinbryantia formatexigens DSM 14469]SDG44886.1 hypothetical protein SAMN05660368_02585 [Marvinbryantia formatexigens]
MKKNVLKTLSLALVAAGSISMMASAATVDQDNQTSSTTVTYSMPSSYTVTIPEAVKIGEDGTGTGEVSIAANPILPAGQEYVQVQIDKGKHWTNSTWSMMILDENGKALGKELRYWITKTGTWKTVYENTPLLELKKGSAVGASTTLTFALEEKPTTSGDYTDTLTFMVKLSENSSKYAQ